MRDIFALDQKFDESLADEYTLAKLEEKLQLSLNYDAKKKPYRIKGALRRCEETFPCCKIEWEQTDLQNRFECLKFLNYLLRTENKCQCEFYMECRKEQDRPDCENCSKYKKGPLSIFDCIEKPSDRYKYIYQDMISEIHALVSPKVISEIIGETASDLSACQNAECQYAESIDSTQQFISRIARSLMPLYSGAPDRLYTSLPTLYGQLEKYRLKEPSSTITHSFRKAYSTGFSDLRSPIYFSERLDCLWDESVKYWDELYIRLFYSKDFYWQTDLLSTYRKVWEIVKTPVDKDKDKFYFMRCPEMRLFRHNRNSNFWLVLSGNKIEESNIPFCCADENVPPDERVSEEKYQDALKIYVENNLEKLAKSVFCWGEVSPKEKKRDKKRIKSRFDRVRKHLKIEEMRYGRSDGLTYIKLISIYQAIFMALPRNNLASEPGTYYAETPSGLRRQRNNPSSLYNNYEEKDPYLLQTILALSEYQSIWNRLPLEIIQFADISLKLKQKTLEMLLEGGWRFRPAAMQLRAESILFLMMNSLIPDEDDWEEIKELILTLTDKTTVASR